MDHHKRFIDGVKEQRIDSILNSISYHKFLEQPTVDLMGYITDASAANWWNSFLQLQCSQHFLLMNSKQQHTAKENKNPKQNKWTVMWRFWQLSSESVKKSLVNRHMLGHFHHWQVHSLFFSLSCVWQKADCVLHGWMCRFSHPGKCVCCTH